MIDPAPQWKVRKYSNTLLDLMEQGVVDPKTLVNDLICWMSEAEVEQFCRTYEYMQPEEDDDL